MHSCANPMIGSATAQVAGHRVVDVCIRWVGNFAKQRRSGHHLAGMTVTALRYLQFEPGLLHRMTEIARKSLDCRTEPPWTRDAGVTQARTGAPFRCTVQAPQRAIPQPYFVPVKPSASRRTQSSGVDGSSSKRAGFPLTLNSTMTHLLDRKSVV